MEAGCIVAAFSDSPALQETLSVLLEHECQLQFTSVESLTRRDVMPADLALVAMRSPAGVLREIATHWPALPVVAVSISEVDLAAPPAPSQARTVPLEPNAIRTAVRQELARHAAGLPASAVALIAEAFRVQLASPITALRAVAGCAAQRPGANDAVLADVLRQQSYVLSQVVDQLNLFRMRPHRAVLSERFIADLCGDLELVDNAEGEPTVLCDRARSGGAAAQGPVTLVPTLTAFLRAHLRRWSNAPVVCVRGSEREISMQYPVRPPGGGFSLPLMLAGLVLQPWSWRVFRLIEQHEETVRIAPATAT
jgi:hypothetical protein